MRLQELYKRYKDRVETFVVYIQEAHPSDGWQLAINEHEGVLYAQPANAEEREHVAESCVLDLDLSIPTLLDDMENSTDAAYAALPDRLYLVGKDGRIVYRSGPGPWGFRTGDLEAAMAEYLDATPA